MEAISGEVLWVLALLHVPIPSFMDLEVMIVNSKCGDTLMLGHLYHSEFGRFSRDISSCESVCTLLHCPNQYKCCFNAYSAGSYCMVCCSCRHIKYIPVLPDIKGLCAGVFRIRQIRWSVLCMLRPSTAVNAWLGAVCRSGPKP